MNATGCSACRTVIWRETPGEQHSAFSWFPTHVANPPLSNFPRIRHRSPSLLESTQRPKIFAQTVDVPHSKRRPLTAPIGGRSRRSSSGARDLLRHYNPSAPTSPIDDCAVDVNGEVFEISAKR